MAGPAAFDEMGGIDAPPRPAYAEIAAWFREASPDMIANRKAEAEAFFRRIGITFAVYGDEEGAERIIPFDILPRILSATEWQRLAEGLEQRVQALNAFIGDVYGAREIVRAGIVPEDLILANPAFRPEMTRIRPAKGLYCHVAGIDLVRTGPECFHVLEDNCRTPSGVSYMMENREAMLRLFPELFSKLRVKPVDQYPEDLHATLRSLAPATSPGEPTVVVLTPGPYNSAYYEHSFLADRMGVELVEGRDLFVRGNIVYMRTTEGPQRVDVIYRRIDDEYLDPLAFRPDSTLGVPGLMSAYKAGNVTLTNAVGTGVADDKAIYSYMPEIVRFFTGRDPILANVETWRCREPAALDHVLANLAKLVVKEVNGSGGYGMLVGPHATRAQCEAFAAKIRANPENYIAQPTLALSTVPAYVEEGLAPRHVDLRPFVLTGADRVRIVPGGLTRVALKKGSLVVNSSQGGGTKDTWVLETDPPEAGPGADAPAPAQNQTNG
ncbi:MAG: circularly permuted type 2 ATP-grasp protein [Hyphomicrobiales bacterium]|uniref:circularly permuted type 2 ATP-grasp protein n=1 Tax=Rhabdaerophilum calidifontis TaxID=2604328 RepID=UPI001238F9CC|nr:circularly permuted type 2 ATP-grasp protein [Rhabdaerophilum calidifontis]MCA1952456.1 circularly permuted type 2 ATP-grasp protein [Hyphomicrobiales bacterium]MCA1998391.1 circularly permuted type 2 ATP-grasp protein [Hyphomicrobiales bacterium]